MIPIVNIMLDVTMSLPIDVLGVMSPNPTVEETVALKYKESYILLILLKCSIDK
jgi:hypothetical protein